MVLGERSRCNSHSNLDYSTNERPYGSSALVCCQCCLSTHSPCSTSQHRDTTVDDVGSKGVYPAPVAASHASGGGSSRQLKSTQSISGHPSCLLPLVQAAGIHPRPDHSWVILLIHGRNAIVGALWNLRQASSSNCLSLQAES